MSESAESHVHSVSSAYRVIASESRWNSIELNFNLLPFTSLTGSTSVNKFSKSYDYNLFIADKKTFKRFQYVSVSLVFLTLFLVLLLHFLSHKHSAQRSTTNFTVPVNKALLFFDAQKSGPLPKNGKVKFRGDSGLNDGTTTSTHANLVGGFYDSGNNIKFSFPTAYTVTLLSWTVIEYPEKYENMGELDHIKDIIKWGTDYLLKVFVPPNTTTDSTILYSQVGSGNSSTSTDNDISCWQRPEDMTYPRPVSICRDTGSDLAGEIVAALSAASLVFGKEKPFYSITLVKAAEKLFGLATENTHKQGTYTTVDECGGQARQFYNSSGYLDELAWGGTWLFFATGNTSYLSNATANFELAMENELSVDTGVFYWNNKLPATAVLLTRLRYFHDPGNPYEFTLERATTMTDGLICSYLSQRSFNTTPGGLIMLRPHHGAPLQHAAAVSFLSKLYSDYLYTMKIPGVRCVSQSFSLENLQSFPISQVNYILGNNPMKLSYLVGFKDKFPGQVYHRGASIPWDNQRHSCGQGKRWLNSKDQNPNVIIGAMVAGPDQDDNFVDSRAQPEYTEPSISGNAGLIAALVALHEVPHDSSKERIDKTGIFTNIRLV